MYGKKSTKIPEHNGTVRGYHSSTTYMVLKIRLVLSYPCSYLSTYKDWAISLLVKYSFYKVCMLTCLLCISTYIDFIILKLETVFHKLPVTLVPIQGKFVGSYELSKSQINVLQNEIVLTAWSDDSRNFITGEPGPKSCSMKVAGIAVFT